MGLANIKLASVSNKPRFDSHRRWNKQDTARSKLLFEMNNIILCSLFLSFEAVNHIFNLCLGQAQLSDEVLRCSRASSTKAPVCTEVYAVSFVGGSSLGQLTHTPTQVAFVECHTNLRAAQKKSFGSTFYSLAHALAPP